jgi:hypothetical protein
MSKVRPAAPSYFVLAIARACGLVDPRAVAQACSTRTLCRSEAGVKDNRSRNVALNDRSAESDISAFAIPLREELSDPITNAQDAHRFSETVEWHSEESLLKCTYA